MDKAKKKLFFLFLILFALGAGFVSAQSALEVDYPTVPGAEAPSDTKTALPDYVKYIFNFSLAIAGFVAFASFVYGGVKYLVSAGSAAAISDAKKQIFAGILGLIILFSSFIILNTVNPQLLFFDISKADPGPPPEIVTLPPVEEQTLYATEIPLGSLIDWHGDSIDNGSKTSPLYAYEGVLTEKRYARILELSKKVWKLSKDIQKVSEEISEASQTLQELVQQCVCGNCSSNCGGCDACPCSCSGDPCASVRGEINNQKSILSAKAVEILPFIEKLEELLEEMDLEREKIKNSLDELEKGELIASKCPSSISDTNKTSVLLSSSDFWNYKEGIESGDLAEAVEVKKIWEEIDSENDATNFYCAETPFDVLLIEEVSVGDLGSLFPDTETAEEPKSYCEAKIPIGTAVDNTEDIANRLMAEMKRQREEGNKIILEIPKESENAEGLSALPTCYSCSDWCSCSCSADWDCCGDEECDPCCTGCSLSQSCQGNPCPGEKAQIASLNNLIQGNHGKITNSFAEITSSDDEVNNLIKGDEIHNESLAGSEREPTWANDLIKNILPAARDGFNLCVNSAEDWMNALSGEEILTKNVLECEEAKDVCWDIEEDYECHGEDAENSFPDYVCTETASKK